MRGKMIKILPLALLALVGATTLIPMSQAQKPDAAFSPQIPKVWDEEDLRSWSLPLVGLGQPPAYIFAEYYYRMPERTIYRSYPDYALGKEPPGYMEWLRRQEPEVSFDPAKLKTEADWIKAGEIVFESPISTLNSITVEDFHDPAFYKAVNSPLAADSTLPHFRYFIKRKGEVVVALPNCASCHSRVLSDGRVISGAQGNNQSGRRMSYGLRRLGATAARSPFPESSVPWLNPDPAEQLKHLSFEDLLAVTEDANQPGVIARLGTSFLYPP